MPNHVQNILTVVGPTEHLQAMLHRIKDDKEVISFQKIKPMPKELEGTRSPSRIVTESEYKKLQYNKVMGADPDPMFDDKGPITKKISKDWIERFGADNWWDWTNAHWGTKWGAYSSNLDVHELKDRPGYSSAIINFQTAWASGRYGIAILGEEYDTLEFHLIYADEDCGSNTGQIWWKEGFISDEDIPDYSMENYFECWGGIEDWEFVDGDWRWKDVDEE